MEQKNQWNNSGTTVGPRRLCFKQILSICLGERTLGACRVYDRIIFTST